MTEHTAAVKMKDGSSQVAAHCTGLGHILKFQEAEIPVRVDNRVSRELLESWSSGPQSINKRNGLRVPHPVLRHSLSRGINHVERTPKLNYPGDSGPDCRVIIKPTFDMNDEIAAINDSDAD
ncbi:hypothetical protein SprV_0200773600 [Sparganum proliferum]